jgi:hypothetical protein
MYELDVSPSRLCDDAGMGDFPPAIAGGEENHVTFLEFISGHLFTDFYLICR